MMRIRILGGLALLALAACGTATAQDDQRLGIGAAPVADHYPPPRTVERLAVAKRFDNAGIELDVPAATDTPAITYTQAYAVCQTGDPACVPDLAPTITLAQVTARQAGTALPDGSIDPIMSKTLAYVLTWTDVPCMRKSGMPGSTETPPVESCTVMNFVDAKTGDTLYGFEGPNP